ncbi:P-loop NTPase fold protein [Aquimarina rhabdastrellae]
MQLDITVEAERFNEHLLIEGNDHIIFSGIFGIGKTYFLKDFFKDRDEYEVFTISPVNYSISSNDDVINYIKYDLAFQLLGKDIDFEKLDISKIVATEYYIKNNALEAISILAKGLGKIGKSIATIAESTKEFKEKVEAYQNEQSINDEKKIIEFLEQIKDQNGSIYEEDMITQLVGQLINASKNIDNEEKITKQTVLIIDDLDRLDPDHIFRILNIFACHFDLDTNDDNKFNLDKIILVCDMDNIRKIFHHRYGVGVDFNGYLDKFYNHEIFYYNNKAIIKRNVEEILKKIKLSHDFNNLDKILNLKQKNPLSKIITNLLVIFIQKDLLNLRSLLKFNTNNHYPIDNYFFVIDTKDIPHYAFPIVLIFDFLSILLGSSINLKILLNKLPENDISIQQLDFFIISFLNHHKHLSHSNLNQPSYIHTFSIHLNKQTFNVEYRIDSKGSTNEQFFGTILRVNGNSYDSVIKQLPTHLFIQKAFDQYLNLEKERVYN